MLQNETQCTYNLTEENFSNLLPAYLRKASRLYFTPIHIAQIASQWLTEGGKKHVLDIGAGVGKFCITGASHSDSFFYGVEYRTSLANLANGLINHFDIKNASVHKGNITDVDFNNFNSFYLFNPFYENLIPSMRLNDEVELAGAAYSYYLKETEIKLDNSATGTRLVTYHGNNFEVPESFKKIKETPDGFLKLWIKN